MLSMPLGEVHLITGNGAGKSTSAYGVAMRALGHGLKVIVIQFMKGRKNIGEYIIQKKLKNYEVKQFGRSGWVDLKHPSQTDKKLAQKGLQCAYNALKKKPFLLVLDEINLACAAGLLDAKEVLKFLDNVHSSTYVYLIGRHAPKELIKRADFVTVVENTKEKKEIKCRKGIEY